MIFRSPKFLCACLALWALALTFWYGGVDYQGRFSGIDLKYYRQIAEAAPRIDAGVDAPFVYRVLPSYVAGLLPGSEVSAFRLCSSLGLMALLPLLFVFLLRQSVAAAPAFFTAALFGFNAYLFGGLSFDYFRLGDTCTLLLILLLLMASDAGKTGWFALLLALGAASRETALLMLPVALYQAWRKGDGLVKWGLAGLPALGVFFALRASMHPGNGGWSLAEAFRSTIPYKFGKPETWYRLFVNAYSPLALLPVLYWEETKRFLSEKKELCCLYLLVFAASFAGGDWERLIAPGFAAAYTLLARIVDRGGLLRQKKLAVLIVFCCFLASWHHLMARFPAFGRGEYALVNVASLAALTAGVWWWGKRKTGADGAGSGL